MNSLMDKLIGPEMNIPPGLRRRFLAYHRRDQIANSRVASILVMVLMPAGCLLDFFVYPQYLKEFCYLRLVSSVLAAACFGLLWLPRFSKRYFRFLSFTWFFIPTFFISSMIFISEGAASPYYAGLNLVLVTVCWVAQVTFRESLVAFSTTLGLYLTACLAHGALDRSLFFNNLYFIVLTGITMVIGNFILNRLRLREYMTQSLLAHSRRELEDKNKQLLELDESKSRFFANISHELRTPLTLILAPLQRLKEFDVQKKNQELLATMESNALRLLKLINDLLDLARFDIDQARLYPEKLEAVGFLKGLLRLLKGYAATKNISLKGEFPNHALYILADPERLEKIILNLLFNALKFTPKDGEVLLTCFQEDDSLVIEVTDNGPGIAAQDHENIFNPFWQADDHATRKNQGAGLGLALARQLSEAHGARLTVNSIPGRGATFRCAWPLPTGADLATATANNQPTPRLEAHALTENKAMESLHRRAELFPLHVVQKDPTSETGSSPPSDRPVALIADDEPEMRSFLAQQLADDYQIIEADNGREALDSTRLHQPNLVLLDYMMPGIDGLEVCRQLQSTPETSRIPVILLTARADEKTRHDVLAAGATDFLTKPFNLTELHSRCRNLTRLRQAQLTVESQKEDLQRTLELVKQTEAELVQTAKMASLGQLSAGLLHEVNNPLSFSISAARALARLNASEFDSAEGKEILQDLLSGLNRATNILSSLRRFAHPEYESTAPVEVSTMIRDCSLFLRASLTEHQIELKNEIPPEVHIQANKSQIEHVFLNIMQNAIDSLVEKKHCSPPGWSPQIVLRWKRFRTHAEISIHDNGLGIAEEHRDRLLEPFFTTKEVGKGLGLGLSISYRILRSQGANLTVTSQKGKYCTFSMEFPLPVCQPQPDQQAKAL